MRFQVYLPRCHPRLEIILLKRKGTLGYRIYACGPSDSASPIDASTPFRIGSVASLSACNPKSNPTMVRSGRLPLGSSMSVSKLCTTSTVSYTHLTLPTKRIV